jgi:hypothetical protein
MKPVRGLLQQMANYEWCIQSKPRGLSGPQLGAGAGQSTEFLDHRVYVAGDDIRRIDWNAVARTDQILIKRYQEEIRPSVVLFVDDSQSMVAFPDKEQAIYDGVAWLHQSIVHLEATTKTVALEQGPLDVLQTLRGDWSATSSMSLGEGLTRRMGDIQRGAHVVLLTDLLSPHEPTKLALLLRQRAHRCTIVQVLGRDDWNFDEGMVNVQDSETGEVVTMSLDAESIAAYRQRVNRIQSDWRESLQGWGELVVMQSPQSWGEVANELLRLGCLSISQ